MKSNLKPETEAAIRARAHQIWEEEGRPEGRQDIHWQSAYEAIVNIAPVTPTVAADVPLIDGAAAKTSKPPRAKAAPKKK